MKLVNPFRVDAGGLLPDPESRSWRKPAFEVSAGEWGWVPGDPWPVIYPPTSEQENVR